MAVVEIHENQLQLLEVIGEPGAVVKSEFALSGQAISYVEALPRDTNVIITIATLDGHVVARSTGWVKGVNSVRDKIGGKWGTTLKHQIKLGEEAPELI